MAKRNELHRGNGATIGGALIVGLILAAFTCAARGEELRPPQPCAHMCHHAEPGASDNITEFAIMQPQTVNSVVCTQWFAHVDFQGYGSIEGAGCQSTAPIASTIARSGHTSVNFTMTDGTTVSLSGCRAVSSVLSGGSSGEYNSVTVNCV